MGFTIHIYYTMNLGLPIVYFKGWQKDFFQNYDVLLSPKVLLILVNSAKPDEMQNYVLHFIWLLFVC